jgi:hypothetical protein
MRRDEHQAGVRRLDQLEFEFSPGGLVLGRDLTGQPVVLHLPRRKPTRITLVGSRYLARVLALRASALGLAIQVRATQLTPWQRVGQVLPIDQFQLLHQPLGMGPVAAPWATAADSGHPVLRIEDPGQLSSAQADWVTELGVYSLIGPGGVGALDSADLILLQRQPAHALDFVSHRLGLSPQLAQALTALPDDQVLVVTGQQARLVQLTVTLVEEQVLGPPGAIEL